MDSREKEEPDFESENPDIENHLDYEEDSEEEEIFRRGLYQRTTDPEQLDAQLQVVAPAFWVLLLGLILSILTVLIWALAGTLPIEAIGKGVFMSKEGTFTIKATAEEVVQQITIHQGELAKKGTDLLDVSDLEHSDVGSKVISPFEGKILDILVSPGQLVEKGDALIWIEHPISKENPLVVYGYFPLEVKNELLVGQKVEMSNGLEGTISKIFPYVVSANSISRHFESEEMKKYLTSKEDPKVMVMIDPGKEKTKKDSEIKTGTIVDLKVTLKTVRPIYYLIPFANFKDD